MTQATAIHPAIDAKTCSTCPYFSNYIETNGKGWCNLFDRQARTHHEQTNDCVVNSETAIQEREIFSAIDTNREKELITIEFAPKIHEDETEYTYKHPQFVFGEEVEVKGSFSYPAITYKVCALELLESKTPSGKLLNQPSWKYKISDGEQIYWKDETALVLPGDNEPVENSSIFTLELQESKHDLPYSIYQVGSIVKVIDADEDHTQWGVFEIIECKYHESNYPIAKSSYINETHWFFRLASNDDASTISESLWVREDEICFFDRSHNVCTYDIF